MKKLMMTLVAALLMSATAMAQENNGQRPQRQMDPAEMAKAQTERMAEEYGLSAEQKDKLLELNTKYAGKIRMGGMRGMRGGQGGPRGGQGGMQQGERPSREQMEARMKEMRENQEAYKGELKKILSEEQFTKYEEAEKQRMERFGRGGFGGPRRNQ